MKRLSWFIQNEVLLVCINRRTHCSNDDICDANMNFKGRDTFSCGPSIVTIKIPAAPIIKFKSKSQPPFAKMYAIERLLYWRTPKMKNFNVLNGWFTNVKFSSSSFCFLRSSANYNKLIRYWNTMETTPS